MHSQGVVRAKGIEKHITGGKGRRTVSPKGHGVLGINAHTHPPATFIEIHWDFQSILARERRQKSKRRYETEIQRASDQKSSLSSTYSSFLFQSQLFVPHFEFRAGPQPSASAVSREAGAPQKPCVLSPSQSQELALGDG